MMFNSKKMTTDQMITAAQAAMAQDMNRIEQESAAAMSVFTQTENKLAVINARLEDEIEKLKTMEEALTIRRTYAEKLLERNMATAQKIRSMIEG